MKARHKRLAIILGALASLGVATALILNALNSNIALFVTPTEVAEGKAPQGAAFRVGGLVKPGSLKRDGLTARFVVTDTAKDIPVAYTGILPDLFREKQAVVATGRMHGQVFVAEQVLAKHDETYVPKEVADKMGLAHQKHNVRADTPSAEMPPTDTPSPQR